jgi:phage terminase large subunit-like protein
MRATFSYASILHTIGQVLDQIGVKSIAIHEEEDGLFVEGFNSEGQLQVQMRYDIPSLYELVSRAEGYVEEHSLTREDEGVLHRFLVEHKGELVGAAR